MRRNRQRAPLGMAVSLGTAVMLVVLGAAVVAIPEPGWAQSLGTWITRRPLNTMRTEVGGAVVAGRLHIVGSFPGSTGGPGVHEAYDPATDTWTTLAPLP